MRASDRIRPKQKLRRIFCAALLLAAGTKAFAQGAQLASSAALPDSPGAALIAAQTAQQAAGKAQPCPADSLIAPGTGAPAGPPCERLEKPHIVVDAGKVVPLSTEQKGTLAAREVVDPLNLLTLTGQAALIVATNSHTAYGPGFKGYGRLTGYALLGDATGAFFGVFAVPSLTHEDPRYHRMPNARLPRRVLHAVAHTVIAESDDGREMPNFATLATYPITAELANLYVPGVHGNAPSTARRIALGFATDPISNLIGEFLPDIARHIHLRSVFFQQIINSVALGTTP